MVSMGTNQIQDILTQLAYGRNLTYEMAERAFHIILTGGATPAQIGAFLMGLRAKGETTQEILAGSTVMRHKANSFEIGDETILDNVLDTCGTGGDGKRTFNISTAASIVIASCGVKVVKHGNRSITSASGSSDVLQHLNVKIDAPKQIQQQAFEQLGFCYLMAPLYHPAMRHVTDVRKELGLRTIFNLLGPLANPARCKRQLIGVYDAKWLKPMAECLRELGANKVWLVHGADGMDEITTTTISHIVELNDGQITEFTLNPTDCGVEIADEMALKGGLPAENAIALQDLLNGKHSAYRDIVLLNAAAGLVVADSCTTLTEGIKLAAEAIDSGKAKTLLANYAEMTNK
jgi:anthranilate phosphoribosyltransferase